MFYSQRIALSLAFAVSLAAAGSSFAQDATKAPVDKETKAILEGALKNDNDKLIDVDEKTKAIIEEAVKNGNDKLIEEVDRVPGLKYEDISRIAGKIPGKVQIPNPASKDFTSRAVSVPGGLVSNECKQFARGLIAKRMMMEDPKLEQKAAMAMVIGHLNEQRAAYAKLVGSKEGLKRSDVAIHDAKCPVCGPLNAAEIACHKEVEKNSPVRELVRFEFASDKLRGGHALATIQEIKTLLNKDPDLQVALIGRSSIPGGPVPNFMLSSKRIANVWQGLNKAGVPIDRIVAIPIGEDEPHIDLQLAMDYGLEGDFAAYGQEPLNQSVNVVVFRPSKKTVSEAAPAKTN
jgi:outer membrane protein OmpA-like peptidoglycan-associated protein